MAEMVTEQQIILPAIFQQQSGGKDKEEKKERMNDREINRVKIIKNKLYFFYRQAVETSFTSLFLNLFFAKMAAEFMSFCLWR